jgi:hypothetical protein
LDVAQASTWWKPQDLQIKIHEASIVILIAEESERNMADGFMYPWHQPWRGGAQGSMYLTCVSQKNPTAANKSGCETDYQFRMPREARPSKIAIYCLH